MIHAQFACVNLKGKICVERPYVDIAFIRIVWNRGCKNKKIVHFVEEICRIRH